MIAENWTGRSEEKRQAMWEAADRRIAAASRNMPTVSR